MGECKAELLSQQRRNEQEQEPGGKQDDAYTQQHRILCRGMSDEYGRLIARLRRGLLPFCTFRG